VLKALAQWPELSDPQRNMFTGYAVYIPAEILKVRKGNKSGVSVMSIHIFTPIHPSIRSKCRP
jgi:hypothetical protein